MEKKGEAREIESQQQVNPTDVPTADKTRQRNAKGTGKSSGRKNGSASLRVPSPETCVNHKAGSMADTTLPKRLRLGPAAVRQCQVPFLLLV